MGSFWLRIGHLVHPLANPIQDTREPICIYVLEEEVGGLVPQLMIIHCLKSEVINEYLFHKFIVSDTYGQEREKFYLTRICKYKWTAQ